MEKVLDRRRRRYELVLHTGPGEYEPLTIPVPYKAAQRELKLHIDRVYEAMSTASQKEVREAMRQGLDVFVREYEAASLPAPESKAT